MYESAKRPYVFPPRDTWVGKSSEEDDNFKSIISSDVAMDSVSCHKFVWNVSIEKNGLRKWFVLQVKCDSTFYSQ